jgi:DNA-binding XRE family transcriptional regulator
VVRASRVHLGEPFTRQLRGKLRELRFHVGRQQTRVSYYVATGRRIVLLTVFVLNRQRDRLEVQRVAINADLHHRGPHCGGRRMTRKTWEGARRERADSPARRRGYERAERAIRLAMEIHDLREKRGLSQRELDERAGTTQSAVARLEACNVSPSLPTLEKVAEALGVELVVSFVDLDERIAGLLPRAESLDIRIHSS